MDVGEFGRGSAIQQRSEVVKEVLHFIDAFSAKAKREEGWSDVTPWPRRAGVRGGQRRRALTLTQLPRRAAMLFQYVDPGCTLAYVRGHSLMLTGPWLWCLKCGARMLRGARGLAKRCPGKPSPSGRVARARLLGGKHPRSGVVTSWRPQRVTRDHWEALQAGAALGSVPQPRAEDEELLVEARRQGAARWQALVERVRAREAAFGIS